MSFKKLLVETEGYSEPYRELYSNGIGETKCALLGEYKLSLLLNAIQYHLMKAS